MALARGGPDTAGLPRRQARQLWRQFSYYPEGQEDREEGLYRSNVQEEGLYRSNVQEQTWNLQRMHG